MRAWLPVCAIAALATGCVDYDELQKDFCATAGVKLCDDFESANVGGSWNQVTTGGGAISIAKPTDSDNPKTALRGVQVVKFQVPAGGGAMLEDSTVTSGVGLKGDLFVRAFFYMADTSPVGRMDFISVRDEQGMPIVTLTIENSQAKLTTADGREATGGNALGGNRWVCFELAVYHDSSSTPSVPRAELSVEENTQIQLGGLTSPSLNFTSTRVGADRSSVMTAVDSIIAMDDVIIDSAKITCKK